jgi:hypothetical protein
MSTVDDDWQGLVDTWQAQPVDLPRLRRRTRWKTWRMRAVVAGELAATLFLFVLTWWAWDRPGTTDLHRLWFAIWCVSIPFAQAFTLAARRGIWRTRDDSVSALLRLQHDRARAGERLGLSSIVICLVMLIALGAWSIAFHLQHPPADAAIAARRLWTLGAAFAWLVGFAAVSWWYLRRQRRERAHWRNLLERISGD